jgi:hypothetical protein
MNKNFIEQYLQLAEASFENEKRGEVNQLLQEALNLSQYDKKVGQDILFFYVDKEMYEEALQLLNNYKKETGEDLPSDFSVEDLANLRDEKEKTESRYAKQDIKVFKKRKSLKSNLFCFIKQVRISDEHIEFVFKNRVDRYPWSTLSDSYITKKDTPRGPYSDTKDHVIFVFNKHKYKLRIDPVFDDLEDTNIFLKEVEKHCNLRIQKKKVNTLWIILCVVLVILLIYLGVRYG